jgi:hypothetical protein
MRNNKKELDRKKGIQLEKRLNELYEIKRKSPWTPVAQPFQEGWKLVLKLIPEAERRKDGQAMSKALEVCARDYVTRDSKVVSAVRRKSMFSDVKALLTWRDDKGKLHYNGPVMVSIKPKTYVQLPPEVAKFFYNVEVGKGRHIMYKCDIPVYYITVKVKKRMVTALQNVNPDVEKEISETRKALEPYWRSCGSHYDDHFGENKRERRHSKDAIQKVMKGEIEDVKAYKKLSKGQS